MTINQSIFTAQSGDYSAIANVITVNDALNLEVIVNAIESHAQTSRKPNDLEAFYTLQDYVMQGICVGMEGVDTASLATLKAVGVIITPDYVHVGLTPTGYGFYQFIQV